MDILAPENAEARERIVALLEQAYWMEMETVMSYTANAINPDGVRADPVRASLLADVQEELGHAQLFGRRIKALYGTVPGTERFTATQSELQPPADAIDLVHVIRGVIAAERGAIEHYTRIIDETEGTDPVTQDMVIAILADEQGHLRTFEGFLREFEQAAYFGSKYALLARLAERISASVFGFGRAWFDGAGDTAARAELEEAIGGAFQTWSTHAAVLRALIESGPAGEETAKLWEQLMARFTDGAAARIERDRASGVAPADRPDPRTLAASLVWMTERALYLSIAGGEPAFDDRERAVATLAEVWWRAIYRVA